MVARRRQAEQGLQQPVDMRRLEQVGAAHHVGDALPRIVDGDREMIGGGRILAREHDVAESLRLGGDIARLGVMPRQRAGERRRIVHRQPPGVRLLGHPPRALDRIEMAARARIDRALRPVRRGGRHGDIGTRAEAGVEQSRGAQRTERGAIGIEPARLADRRLVPVQLEPAQVLEYTLDEAFAAPPRVDVLDPQQETATSCACQIMRGDRGDGVAEMQPSGWARREARDDGSAKIGNRHAGP